MAKICKPLRGQLDEQARLVSSHGVLAEDDLAFSATDLADFARAVTFMPTLFEAEHVDVETKCRGSHRRRIAPGACTSGEQFDFSRVVLSWSDPDSPNDQAHLPRRPVRRYTLETLNGRRGQVQRLVWPACWPRPVAATYSAMRAQSSLAVKLRNKLRRIAGQFAMVYRTEVRATPRFPQPESYLPQPPSSTPSRGELRLSSIGRRSGMSSIRATTTAARSFPSRP